MSVRLETLRRLTIYVHACIHRPDFQFTIVSDISDKLRKYVFEKISTVMAIVRLGDPNQNIPIWIE